MLSEGVGEDHIIEIAFDAFENKKYRDPDVLYPFLKEQIKDDAMYYVLLDEVHMYSLSFVEFMSVYQGTKQDGDIIYQIFGKYMQGMDIFLKMKICKIILWDRYGILLKMYPKVYWKLHQKFTKQDV